MNLSLGKNNKLEHLFDINQRRLMEA